MTSARPPLCVALVSPTFGGYGGMEAFALTLARGVGASGDIDLRVFFKRTRKFSSSVALADATSPFGSQVQFIDRGGRALWQAVKWADVVHGQNASPDVMLAAKALGRPLLMTMHAHRAPGYSLRRVVWQWALAAADRRFFVSEFVRRTWEGEDRRKGSAVVPPISDLPEGVRPIVERRGFVFAARWIENKGLETLVEAYARASLDPARWPLCLIGDGPLRPRIEQRLAELGLRGVTAPGFLSQTEKAEAIRAARWMVVPPNTREDFGLTAIEARAVGVPCIITRDGGVPEAAGREALVCEPGDVAGLAACLRAAAEMSDDDYAARSRRTREALADELRGPDFYARTYRELAVR